MEPVCTQCSTARCAFCPSRTAHRVYQRGAEWVCVENGRGYVFLRFFFSFFKKNTHQLRRSASEPAKQQGRWWIGEIHVEADSTLGSSLKRFQSVVGSCRCSYERLRYFSTRKARLRLSRRRGKRPRTLWTDRVQRTAEHGNLSWTLRAGETAQIKFVCWRSPRSCR